MSTFRILLLVTMVVATQVLAYLFVKSLRWLFSGFGFLHTIVSSSIFLIFVVLVVNLLVLGGIFRIVPGGFVTPVATLVFLWFWALASTAVLAGNVLTFRSIEVFWKMLLPLAFIGLAGYSYWNSQNPIVRYQQIRLEKAMNKPLRLLVASDQHLGYWSQNAAIDKLAQIVKQQKPDAVMLVGDIMDQSPDYWNDLNMAENFKKIKAPDGVFAVLGNHEYYGGIKGNLEALEKSGATLLTDQVAVVENKFAVVGRLDATDGQRKSLDELIAPISESNLPIILLDHQPQSLDRVQKAGVDISLHGHTHNGQIFPGNLIVSLIWDLAYGYQQRGNTHYVVSSGFGFWGVPLRLGSRSEVWVLDVLGKGMIGAYEPESKQRAQYSLYPALGAYANGVEFEQFNPGEQTKRKQATPAQPQTTPQTTPAQPQTSPQDSSPEPAVQPTVQPGTQPAVEPGTQPGTQPAVEPTQPTLQPTE